MSWCRSDRVLSPPFMYRIEERNDITECNLLYTTKSKENPPKMIVYVNFFAVKPG